MQQALNANVCLFEFCIAFPIEMLFNSNPASVTYMSQSLNSLTENWPYLSQYLELDQK